MFLNMFDSLKDSIVLDFTKTVPTLDIVLSLLTAILAALIIDVVYKKTYIGVNYTKSFSLSIVLLSMVTSLVIKTINSNLSLSLGMVGALSIVRFRTAVKDPIDTIFMFWAITVGIMSGAGLYLLSVFSTFIIGLVYFICFAYQTKKSKKMLLVIKTYIVNSNTIINIMKKSPKAMLKTESYKNNIAELTYELADRSEADEILKYKGSPGIISMNLLDIE